MHRAGKLILAVLLAAPLLAQNGQSVNQVSGSPNNSVVQQLFYSGSNLTYVCYAPALTPLTTVLQVQFDADEYRRHHRQCGSHVLEHIFPAGLDRR